MHDKDPKVTIVVPTKNRPIALASLMGSLFGQTLENFDLAIALNGENSWDKYLDKLVLGLETRGIRVRISECLDMTFAELHAHLVSNTETEYVCRLDDDHVPDPSYLENLLNTLKEVPGIGAAGGIVLHPEVPGHSFTSEEFKKVLESAREKAILNTILQLKRHPTRRPLRVPDLYSTFMVSRKVIKEVGGIATCYRSSGYREETDLTLRMTLAGHDQYIVPTAVVWHIKSDQEGERKPLETWKLSQVENQALFEERLLTQIPDLRGQFNSLWSHALDQNL